MLGIRSYRGRVFGNLGAERIVPTLRFFMAGRQPRSSAQIHPARRLKASRKTASRLLA